MMMSAIRCRTFALALPRLHSRPLSRFGSVNVPCAVEALRRALSSSCQPKHGGTREEDLAQEFQRLKAGAGRGGGAPAGGARRAVPGVRFLVAVASGKGGVGKSTVAVNLALAFSSLGWRTGLLDVDIYGPSVPLMLGLAHERAVVDEGTRQLQPLQNHNVVCMSMGFLVPREQALVWRGPMVMGAVQQLLFGVAWGALDVLVLDLPPGTGDAQLTLTQSVALSGAVIVSTPQDLALEDALRAVEMFNKVHVPVLGVVENMAGHQCSHCGHVDDVFGRGGARNTAQRLGLPFLGALPLHVDIRRTTDSGAPIVISEPSSPLAQLYVEIAQQLQHTLLSPPSSPSTPKIVLE